MGARVFGVGAFAPSSVLLYAALFTVGWDRVFVIPVGPYSVKAPILFFSAAALAVAVEAVVRSVRHRARPHIALPAWPITAALAVAVAVMIVASAVAGEPRAAFLQIVTVVLGALVPLFAVVAVVRSREVLDAGLVAFIAGGLVAAIFGLYQLAATVLGWPQPIPYDALGGGLPRISSFLYESGYFGYYMVLVIAAIVALARLRSRPAPLVLIGAVVVVTLLANTRAAYIALPLVLLLLFFRRPRRRPRARTLLVIAAGVAAAVIVVLLAAPGFVTFAVDRVGSIFDPTEPSSNAPRLLLLDGGWRIFADHPWLGIGPGNLFFEAPGYGVVVPGDSPNTAIINNIYLQALLDGGPLLLAAQLAFAVLLVMRTFRRRIPAARALMAGWVTVAVVAFLGTSYFWDVKMWAVAGLALTAAELSRPAAAGVSGSADATDARPPSAPSTPR